MTTPIPPTQGLGPGRHRFHGFIAGVGTQEGTRLVVGHWPSSPLGVFTDVMVERANGHRMLLAPNSAVAQFVTDTYHFDETVICPVDCQVSPDSAAPHSGEQSGPLTLPFLPGAQWQVAAGPLELTLRVGTPTPLGRLLAATPNRICTSPLFSRMADPIARSFLRGVRTAGTAGNGRAEYYGATGLRTVTSLRAAWDGVDLGSLRPVEPPVRFGFSSTPRRPSLTRVVTTVDVPEGAQHT
ncbi:hypothetical protein [Gephyromycinifex aptenodytis]|uniref:hypothetical protein n=1 Tax=Gephyromycinifex aptenodytis TaxID=2716227 RepID=UPI00144579FB|nr:hypothetical protein [Gephyromycinifex aptenodytis]